MSEGDLRRDRGNTHSVIISFPAVNPTSGFHVDATIEGTSATFLLDTGTAMILLCKDTWELLSQTNRQKLSTCLLRPQSWWE